MQTESNLVVVGKPCLRCRHSPSGHYRNQCNGKRIVTRINWTKRNIDGAETSYETTCDTCGNVRKDERIATLAGTF